MKVGALIPTMGDRQSISFTFKRAIEMGVEWIVCINKKSPTVDLWNKYLDGLQVLYSVNCDVVLLLEDDDYYPVQYLQEMIDLWERTGLPIDLDGDKINVSVFSPYVATIVAYRMFEPEVINLYGVDMTNHPNLSSKAEKIRSDWSLLRKALNERGVKVNVFGNGILV